MRFWSFSVSSPTDFGLCLISSVQAQPTLFGLMTSPRNEKDHPQLLAVASKRSVLNTAPIESVYSFPIRRTRLTSFWIGLATNIISLLLAAALTALLMLSSIITSGVVVIMVFGLLWGVGFFLSFPWQRRFARSLDLRRPGIRLTNRVLTVPVTDELALQFKLDAPYELNFGWFEVVVSSSGGPTSRTRAVTTYATLAQAGQHVFLKAEESVREAKSAGWSKSSSLAPSAPAVRLWAIDLVALVEAIRR